jgi:hypothetical protein
LRASPLLFGSYQAKHRESEAGAAFVAPLLLFFFFFFFLFYFEPIGTCNGM